MKSFDLLHSDIQKVIYDLEWTRLRSIQDQAITHLKKTDKDLIIAAPTAGGKTEAAMLPLLSLCRDTLGAELNIVYVSPLKALINDQFSRIEKICDKLDFTVTKWHGDASRAKKLKLTISPKGILLITPESIEALLINRPEYAAKLFANMKYVVIDEVHSFVGFPRGDQLKSLLHRIQKFSDFPIRKISLSATIGNPEEIAKWHNSSKGTSVIWDKDDSKEVLGEIRYLAQSDKDNDYRSNLVDITSKSKNLLFANSKSILETVCDEIKEFSNSPESIFIHHGSLGKFEREYVEKELKNRSQISVFCTNTLELGIDIGDIDEVTLLSPPWSVSSLIQKVGRSGRTEDRPINFNFSLRKPSLKEKAPPSDYLHPDLIKSIALIELFLSGWCEEQEFLTAGYSTLVHQTIALVSQYRAIDYGEIKSHIHKAFNEKISEADFQRLLQHLGKIDILDQTENGLIRLGGAGESLSEDWDFYSVFFTPDEWSLYTDQGELGKLPTTALYKVNDLLIFGGRRWTVVHVDHLGLSMKLSPSKHGRTPLFMSDGSLIHITIHEAMERVLKSKSIPGFIDENGKSSLTQARNMFKQLNDDPNYLFHFSGTKVSTIISLALRKEGIEIDDFEVGFFIKNASPAQVKTALAKIESEKDLWNLIKDYKVEELNFEKYDYLLPKELAIESYINSKLDLDGFLRFKKRL